MVKEANTAVSTQQTSQDNPLADFGPNEWIVDEMYQRYLADPTSVDPAWHDFFADYKPAMASGSIVTPDEATAANATATAAKRRHRRARRQHRRPGEADRAAPQPRAGPAKPTAPATEPSRHPKAAAERQGRPRARRSPRCAASPPGSCRTWTPRSRCRPRRQRARRPGQAAGRQPHRDQQPPRPRARRQGQLHPPDRLGAGPLGDRAPGDEQLVRRGGRQAGAGRSPSTSTWASRSTWPRRTAPARWSCRPSRTASRWTSASSGRRTRTWSGAPAATS